MLVAALEGGLLAGRHPLHGERHLLPDLGVADLDLDRVGTLLGVLGGAGGGDLEMDLIAARGRTVDLHPLGHLLADVLDRVVDLHRAGIDLGVGEVEALGVPQLDHGRVSTVAVKVSGSPGARSETSSTSGGSRGSIELSACACRQ